MAPGAAPAARRRGVAPGAARRRGRRGVAPGAARRRGRRGVAPGAARGAETGRGARSATSLVVGGPGLTCVARDRLQLRSAGASRTARLASRSTRCPGKWAGDRSDDGRSARLASRSTRCPGEWAGDRSDDGRSARLASRSTRCPGEWAGDRSDDGRSARLASRSTRCPGEWAGDRSDDGRSARLASRSTRCPGEWATERLRATTARPSSVYSPDRRAMGTRGLELPRCRGQLHRWRHLPMSNGPLGGHCGHRTGPAPPQSGHAPGPASPQCGQAPGLTLRRLAGCAIALAPRPRPRPAMLPVPRPTPPACPAELRGTSAWSSGAPGGRARAGCPRWASVPGHRSGRRRPPRTPRSCSP